MLTPPMMSLRFSAKACTSKPWPILSSLIQLPQNQARQLQVLRIGDLEVAAVGLDQPGLEAELLDGRSLVGHVAAGCAQRFGQLAVTEHLRRLRLPQAGARHGG